MRVGFEIVQHEVSVPTVMKTALSCLLFAVTEAGRILLVVQLSRTLQAALEALFMVMLVIATCVVCFSSWCCWLVFR
jgi:hypothetical protein